jgi:hypothetical protein
MSSSRRRRVRGKHQITEPKEVDSKNASICELPIDIFQSILSLLPLRQLWSIGAVNRCFRDFTRFSVYSDNGSSRLYEQTWRRAMERTGLISNFFEWFAWWTEVNIRAALADRNMIRLAIIKLETLDIVNQAFKNSTMAVGTYRTLPFDIRLLDLSVHIAGPARTILEFDVEYTPTLTQASKVYRSKWCWKDSIYSDHTKLADYVVNTTRDSEAFASTIKRDLTGTYYSGKELLPLIIPGEFGMTKEHLTSLLSCQDDRIFVRPSKNAVHGQADIITVGNIMQLARLPRQPIDDVCCPYVIAMKELGGEDSGERAYIAYYISERLTSDDYKCDHFFLASLSTGLEFNSKAHCAGGLKK